jgi:predicted metal-dependent phosphoesterase TrpH
LIDLHTHTTASDGRLTPSDLVARAASAGVDVLGLTDHDTVGGCAAAAQACAERQMAFVPGIEITAVVGEADVHVLGYFVDVESTTLRRFLSAQRQHRVDRLREIIDRLSARGIVLDAAAILQPALADTSKSVGRPWIARAMVAAGHVSDISEAFNRWLSQGRPAFVPRIGASPEEVFARIHEAGGLVSLAHPGVTAIDDRIPAYAAAGMDAIEVYHSDHDEAATTRYLALARRLDLAVTGGSDFHADDEHGGGGPGSACLPREDYARLLERRATRRATASGSSISS